MSENRVIGRGSALPWRLPADMKHFKALTVGHIVVMGRRTFDTLDRPLPQRRNVVVTRDPEYSRPGAEVVHTLSDALALGRDEEEIFVAGGGQIYAAALPHADRIYLTVVHTTLDGDVFFPEIDQADWVLREEEEHQADARHPFPFSFRLYARRSGD